MDDFIKVVISKPIHVLGYNIGSIITIEYTWDELELLLEDISKGRLKVLDKDYDVWVISYTLSLEDLDNAIIKESELDYEQRTVN